jgi:hypothetical protein
MMKHSGRAHAKFTEEEDNRLRDLVHEHGAGDWSMIAERLGSRNARQVKDRWTTYLSNEIKVGGWTAAEDDLLLQKHAELGPKWVQIAALIPGRTDVMVKNRFNQVERRNKRDLEAAQQLLLKSPEILLAMADQIRRDRARRSSESEESSGPENSVAGAVAVSGFEVGWTPLPAYGFEAPVAGCGFEAFNFDFDW